MEQRSELGAGRVAAGVTLALVARRIVRRLAAPSVSGQVVLITGGSRGLGFVLAEEFAGRGARVAICARDEHDLERAAEDLGRRGARVLAVPADVGDARQAEELVDRVTRAVGPVDVLVNNAGVMTVGPLEHQTVEDFRDAMDVMFWGVLYPTLAVLPHMRARRSGRIVNITSIGGKVSAPHLLPYSSAKFAAVGLSEGLRAELAKDGIKVVTVVPWFMRTGSHLNARYKGKPRAEITWFSLGGNLPLTSMNARRAAHRIVQATRTGKAELLLTPYSKLASAFQGLFPGLTADLLGVMNRVLPRAQGTRAETKLGKHSRGKVLAAFTVLGERAAHRFHQFPNGGRS